MAPFRAAKLERDVPADVTTIFQHVEGTADVNTWFVRGCPGRARFTRFSKAAAFIKSLSTKDWYSSDLHAEAAVVAALDRGYASVAAVFPAVDELGHRFGPLCDESYEAYRRFDRCLGRVFDALARLGRADRTLVVVTSDHGQSSTHTHVDIDAVVRQVYPNTLAYPELWRRGLGADAAVMVSGNAMANVYVRGRSGWGERPDFDDDGTQAGELRRRLCEHEAVDHVLYRGSVGGAPAHVVASRTGRDVIRVASGDAASSGPGTMLTWSSVGGSPLGLPPITQPMDGDGVHAATRAGAYPDAPWQIARFFSSPRAGDLVVCARSGFDLRARFEYQPHNGSHGGLGREHMAIPAAVNAAWTTDWLRSVDLFPTILRALGRPIPPGLDGVARDLGA
jgi:arylsulfatase A-like enzyme